MAFSYWRFLRIKMNSLKFDFLCNSFSVLGEMCFCCKNKKTRAEERSIKHIMSRLFAQIVICLRICLMC